MKKSLILAIFLGALTFNEVQAIYADPQPAQPTADASAANSANKADGKTTPKE